MMSHRIAQHHGTRTLTTPRLTLRRFTLEDAGAMYQNWACDPRVTHYLSWSPHRDVAETRALLESWVGHYESATQYSWGIEFEGRLIGSITANNLAVGYNRCEVGYCIAYDLWDRGVVTEALQAVLDELFAVGLHKVCAQHDVENAASGRVMQKCGMTPEARLREHYHYPDGRVSDAILYGILERERRERHTAER